MSQLFIIQFKFSVVNIWFCLFLPNLIKKSFMNKTKRVKNFFHDDKAKAFGENNTKVLSESSRMWIVFP